MNKYRLRIPAITQAWWYTEATSEEDALCNALRLLDTGRIDYADRSVWEIELVERGDE